MNTLNVDLLDFNGYLLDSAYNLLSKENGFITESFIFSDKCRDSVFNFHYKVEDKITGAEIGIFMACNGKEGKQTEKQKRICKFRFADSLFYADNYDFDSTKDKLCNEVGFLYKGVSHLDIAFDTDEAVFFSGWAYDDQRKRIYKEKGEALTGEDFMFAAKYDLIKRDRRFNRSQVRTIDEYNDKELQQLQKKEVVGRFSDCQTVYFGCRKSRCYARIYNKTVEMIAKGEKTFITEMWKNAGYTGEKNVFRFEISLSRLSETASYFYNEDGEVIEPSLNEFFDNKFLRGLFDGVIEDKFVFTAQIRKRPVQLVCLDRETDLAYNCGYDSKKAIDIQDFILHNNYTKFAGSYLLSLSERKEAKENLCAFDRKCIERVAKIFIDMHDDYQPKYPRYRPELQPKKLRFAASLKAAHREIEISKEITPFELRIKYKRVKVFFKKSDCLGSNLQGNEKLKVVDWSNLNSFLNYESKKRSTEAKTAQ